LLRIKSGAWLGFAREHRKRDVANLHHGRLCPHGPYNGQKQDKYPKGKSTARIAHNNFGPFKFQWFKRSDSLGDHTRLPSRGRHRESLANSLGMGRTLMRRTLSTNFRAGEMKTVKTAYIKLHHFGDSEQAPRALLASLCSVLEKPEQWREFPRWLWGCVGTTLATAGFGHIQPARSAAAFCIRLE
jgi:hypothetical protein